MSITPPFQCLPLGNVRIERHRYRLWNWTTEQYEYQGRYIYRWVCPDCGPTGKRTPNGEPRTGASAFNKEVVTLRGAAHHQYVHLK